MGIFYIETSEIGLSGTYLIFELSATTDVVITNTTSITQYPIEDGSQIIDHIIQSPSTVSMNGVITDIASLSITEAPSKEFRTNSGKDAVKRFIEELEKKISDRETFSVYFSNILKPLRNCLITSFSYSKDNKLGGDSWTIKLSFQQIRFANRAQFVYKPNVNWGALVAKPSKAATTKASCSGDQSSKVAGDGGVDGDGQAKLSQASAYDLYVYKVLHGEPVDAPTVIPNTASVAKKSIYK